MLTHVNLFAIRFNLVQIRPSTLHCRFPVLDSCFSFEWNQYLSVSIYLRQIWVHQNSWKFRDTAPLIYVVVQNEFRTNIAVQAVIKLVVITWKAFFVSVPKCSEPFQSLGMMFEEQGDKDKALQVHILLERIRWAWSHNLFLNIS